HSVAGVPDLPRSHLVAYVLAGLLLVFAGARWVRASNAPASAAAGRPAAPPAVSLQRRAQPAVVDVTGEVRHPGLYSLPSGARVADAVKRAGGATRRADLEALNLAARLE